jgi:hypothetical protein
MLTTLALKILGRLRSSVKIKGIDMMTTEKSSFLPENFANPDKTFRPAPFWSLNGDLKDDQLLEQIKFFKEIGFGGYFMHPRPGMRTHYLEEEWFDRVKFMIKCGEEEAMEPWLYDEDSYPSGFASGLVPAAKPELMSCSLCLIKPEVKANYKKIIAEYGAADDYEIIATQQAGGLPWFNNQAYIDTLNPEAVELFIEVTHEQYGKRYAEQFGKLIPGIFTDEPHHNPPYNGESIAMLPWSPLLPAAFERKYGYSLIDNIGKLFLNIADADKVRFDFFNLVNEMFVNNFCKPMFDWCEKHDLELTGHFWEHSYPNPCGQANIMTPLKYMHRPGIDLLGRDVDKFSSLNDKLPHQTGNWQMVKVAGSVARQYGWPRVMSETWGGCGWNQTLEDHRIMADWEIILGINYIVPHLAHYSLEGFRKTDYPLSFSPALPYYKQLRGLNDHLTRVCYSLCCGEQPAQLLVIHPTANNWVNWHNKSQLNADAIELESLTRQLVCSQFEFDFGDEALLQEDGWLKDGQLGLGNVGYDAIIIPKTVTLFSSTLELLQRFVEIGGRVYFYGRQLPMMLDGQITDEIATFATHENVSQIDDFTELEVALTGVIERQVTIESPERIMSTVRLDNDRIILFFANYEKNAQELILKFNDGGRLYLADTVNGTMDAISSFDASGQTYKFKLFSGNSKLVILDKSQSPLHEPVAASEPKLSLIFNGPFAFERLDDNIMLLDHCTYAINDENPSEVMQVEKAKQQCRERYGWLNCPGIRYPREYTRYGTEGPHDTGDRLSLSFQAKIADNVDVSGICLAVEVPERWQIVINGQPVGAPNGQFFMDNCFGVIPVGKLLHSGDNKIVLTAPLLEDIDPDNIFLLGDFGVSLKEGIPQLTVEPLTIDYGAIASQGYQFFAGRIKYRLPFVLNKAIAKPILKFPGMGGVPVFDCQIDGKTVGSITDAPYQLNLSSLTAGEHLLEITLYTHLRQLFGPHYVDEYRNDILIVSAHYNFVYDGPRKLAMKSFACDLLPSIELLSS